MINSVQIMGNKLHGVTVLALVAVTACSSAPRAVVTPEDGKTVVPSYLASYYCSSPETRLQTYVCMDSDLAAGDLLLHELLVHQLRAQDQAGRAALLTSTRRWKLGLYRRCNLEGRTVADEGLQPASLGCLKQAFKEQEDALKAMPSTEAVQAESTLHEHPLAAYVAFRQAQFIEPALCNVLTSKINGLLARYGDLDFGHVSEWKEMAGSHGPPSVRTADGHLLEVLEHDSGPYGGYQLRANGLLRDGKPVLDDQTVPNWVKTLPNAGGDAGGTSSQTRDYGGIDVIDLDARVLIMVTQTWGYYASAARGESPHAALYELDNLGLHARCLWRTYTTPPVAQALRELPQFRALESVLESAAGPDSIHLPPDDRRDAGLLYRNAQWDMIHMPLLGIGEARRNDRWPMLRQRHDEAMEAIFAWSERNVPCKQLYRRLMPLIRVAYAELKSAFQATEGLRPEEAQEAADLVLMASFARAAERLQDPGQPLPELVGRSYRAVYDVAPAPGDLERERIYGGLHSALLNRAQPDVIFDLMRQTWGNSDRIGDPALGRGPAGDTVLMAAVRSPITLGRLLEAGANANDRNSWGKTALMGAAQANQLESVRLLLNFNADPTLRTSSWYADGAGGLDNSEGAHPGRTAMMYAATYAQLAIIEALLTHGAQEFKTSDDQGATPCSLLDENEILQGAERARARMLLCVNP
jgi:hypothetical protein